jgi:hypothetical protein
MKRIALLLVGTCALNVAAAGVYVEMVDRNTATGKSSLTQKMYVQGGQGRFVDEEGRATVIKNKVDGRDCRLWDVKRNNELDEQLCVVPYTALPGKENFQAVFASFAKVFEEMAKSVPTLAGVMDTEFDAQAKVNGFPVRTRQYENGRLANEEQVMQVWREEAIPASMFDVPAGYKQKAMENLGD